MQKQNLKPLGIEGDVEDNAETIILYSHDASLFEVKPEVVIYPKNTSDIKKILKFVLVTKKTEPGISITPRSAGTDMSGGPLNTSIILDFTRYFTTIEKVESYEGSSRYTENDAGYAITEPGVLYRNFEKETLAKGLLLPPFPASREMCTVGGMAANNSAGEKTLTYGKIENFVEELHVIFADGNEYAVRPLSMPELQKKMAQGDFEGNLYKNIFSLIEKNYDTLQRAKPRVTKNSAGYYLWNVWDQKKGIFDLTKLIVGSQGTLGIITKIKYRLVKVPSHSKLLVILMKDLRGLADLVNGVLEYKPESFESYDDRTMQLAVKFLPEMFRIMKTKNIIKLGLEFLPEAWMVLTGGIPKLFLLAEFRGHTQEDVEQRAALALATVRKLKFKSRLVEPGEAEKYWTIRHESFNLLRKHVHGMRTAPFIDDIVVRHEYLPEFLPKLNKILAQYDLIYTIAGHVGDGNFHIIPLMDFKDKKTPDVIERLSHEVYDLVLDYHGSITAEHNDGLIRTPFLEQMFGTEVYRLFEETKRIFDPLGIFNPGKKVGTTMKYMMDHIVKTS